MNCSAGTSFANAINLGSLTTLTLPGDSTTYPDSMIGGCNDPTSGNDGGDVFYKYTAPVRGKAAMCRL